MQQTSESDFAQQEFSTLENIIPYPLGSGTNVCQDWNLSETPCASSSQTPEKDYYGSLPCCTSLQVSYTDTSWNMGYQYTGNQYTSSPCCILDQSNRQPEIVSAPLPSAYDSSTYMKDFMDHSSNISKSVNSPNDYRLLNYTQPQSAYNSTFAPQDPLLYPPYNPSSSNNFSYCLESDCSEKSCHPVQTNYSSCLLEQNMEIRPTPSESLPRLTADSTTELSGLLSLSNPGDSPDLRVNDSDEDSDIIVEDSDTESEISIDVGPYINDKEVVKTSVMRCFVCNLCYSDKSQSNFVQVNSSFPLTFISQTPVMLKLIEIIPIDMQTSVKFENTLICRRCLNLIDTIENLELRLVSVKKALCDFVCRSGKETDDDLNIPPESNDVNDDYDLSPSKKVTKDAEMNTCGEDLVEATNDEKKEESSCDAAETHRAKTSPPLVVALSPYQCDRCGKMYKRQKELAHHLSRHEGKFAEICPECGKGFIKTRNLDLHMRKHRPHVCLHCRASFIAETQLTQHLLVCKENNYICSQCTLLFTTKEKLNSHMEKHKKTLHTCDICSKSFKHPSSLETHKKTHSDDKPFSCDKCNLKYKNQSHLRRHQKSHDNPYNCPVCRANFSNAIELQEHALKHSEKFECHECHKVFASKSNLSEHKKIHLGSRSKKECPLCKKYISSNFKAHLMSHSEEKKFKCDVCNIDFTFKHSLTKHIKKKHELNISN